MQSIPAIFADTQVQSKCAVRRLSAITSESPEGTEPLLNGLHFLRIAQV